jgi:hypothetical protein
MLLKVTSDVGRGRSWLRLALNDGLLGAYLQAMQKDRYAHLIKIYNPIYITCSQALRNHGFLTNIRIFFI